MLPFNGDYGTYRFDFILLKACLQAGEAQVC